jgi:hypothetical protein
MLTTLWKKRKFIMVMKISTSEEYNELAFYTLAHPDAAYFIHQHVVDAYQAQTADEHTKPIAIIFSLAGLYLFTEQGYTGKMVQRVHMKMARNKITWPTIQLPVNRGEINIASVLEALPGAARDEMIKKWVVCVWDAYKVSQAEIKLLVKRTAGI